MIKMSLSSNVIVFVKAVLRENEKKRDTILIVMNVYLEDELADFRTLKAKFSTNQRFGRFQKSSFCDE